jgi:hypothetical protein
VFWLSLVGVVAVGSGCVCAAVVRMVLRRVGGRRGVLAGEREGGGHARYAYRLRVCVAKSRAVQAHNKATGRKATCGPAQLDRMLTEARACTPWLREGSSVVQQ